MQPDTVQHTYEMIDNPILRLLVYFLTAAVIGLCGTVVYLFKLYVNLAQDSVKGLFAVNDALQAIRDELTDTNG